MSENHLPGSTARHPDLDWSQIRETILMLALSVAQIEMSMRDSDGSVEVLSNSFTSMMGQVKMIERVAAALPETAEVASAKAAIIASCTTVSEMMRSAIVAFQFYDKLTQRLGHVNGSMSVLGDLIADQRRLYNPYEWMGMQEKIKSRYTMEEERLMFDAIMQGKTVKQALGLYVQAMEEKKQKAASSSSSVGGDEDIELF